MAGGHSCYGGSSSRVVYDERGDWSNQSRLSWYMPQGMWIRWGTNNPPKVDSLNL